MCVPNILFPVFMFAFIFHCRSFSPCWPLAFLIFSPPLWISMFFSLRNSSPLFSITRSSSFSVIHVSVNIKNNAEKDTTLLLFFLSKSPGGHVISFQIKPWVAFGLPYLLIELFYIGMPVVRTDGRAGGRSVYGHVITKFSRRVDYHISLALGLRQGVELRYENREQCPLTWLVKMLLDSSGLPSSTFIVDEVFGLSAANHISISVFFCQSYSFVFLFCFLGIWKWLPWRLVKCPWF